MKSACLVTLGAVLLAFSVLGVAYAGSKVQICHIPPGNPANFHTITVSDKALPAHLGHGDIPGSCFANAEELCDDGNACTIDAMDEQTESCLIDHPPVDCDDGLLCTTDSCDPTDGCQYAPIVCDDGDLCTVDTCSEFDGQCTGTPIDCGPLGVCLAETGLCDYPCDGITCDPIDQCHEAGECVLPGECVDGAPVADGTACDDGDAGTTNDQCTGGECAGESACPCWTLEQITALRYPAEGDRVGCNVNTDDWHDPLLFLGRDEFEITRDDPNGNNGRWSYNTRIGTFEWLRAASGPGCWWTDDCDDGDCVLASPHPIWYSLTEEELAICNAQLWQAGADRGIGCFQ